MYINIYIVVLRLRIFIHQWSNLTEENKSALFPSPNKMMLKKGVT